MSTIEEAVYKFPYAAPYNLITADLEIHLGSHIKTLTSVEGHKPKLPLGEPAQNGKPKVSRAKTGVGHPLDGDHVSFHIMKEVMKSIHLGAATVTEISNTSTVSHSAICRALTHLESYGMITRTKINNRIPARYQLTESGMLHV